MPQDKTVKEAKVETAPPTLRSILVAEDEHLLARSLCEDLTELGYSVIGPAPNGQVAIDLARGQKPDIALMDIRMPVMDGLAASEVLFKEMGVPVVILSAHSDPMYIKACIATGVFGYMIKPASLDDLRVTMEVSWSRYQEQRRLNDEVEGYKTKLEHRKIIERAKGLLMKNLGLDEEEAMRTLQKQARDSRRQMVDLARALLDTHQIMAKVDRDKSGPTKAGGKASDA